MTQSTYTKKKTLVARIPYLNSAPFFRGLSLAQGYELVDYVPLQLGLKAAAGEVDAGILPLVEYLRLRKTFKRLGHFGIAVRGQAKSALLFSRKPVRQLDGALIALTVESSTTVCLLRLLLEERYKIKPSAYKRGDVPEADALLLIGDQALSFRASNALYPFEIDVGFEWWLWQHLPFVFALWAIRCDSNAAIERELEGAIARSLSANLTQLDLIAADASASLGLSAEELRGYLSSFVYRLGHAEEESILRFEGLVNEHHLL